MPSMRIALSISLTLVAATLPANAWSLPVPGEKEAAKSDGPCKPPPGQKQHDKSGPPNEIRIALTADVWDGSSVRALSAGTGTLSALLLAPPADLPIIPRDISLFARITARIRGEQSQRRWLICRYAHAPPAGA